jgi:cobalt-zinc-cadmium efflux system outer membrane protein
MRWTGKAEQLQRGQNPSLRMLPLLVLMLSLGCSAHSGGMREPAQITQQPRSGPQGTTASDPLRPVAYQSVVPGSKTKQVSGTAKKEADEPGEKGDVPTPKITLPMAIEMCVNNNFRVLGELQKIQLAEADLTTSSLIPNPSLVADYELIPLQHTDIKNQLGPPQADVLVAFPVDWLLFGKRVAAMKAARLGIEVNAANSANVLRAQLAQTVDGFYEVLMDEAYFKLALKNVAELEALEKLTQELARDRKVGDLELDRIKLAVHEAVLDRHDRELALEVARARFRPLIGRTAADADYEVEGVLTVTAMVPVPTLEAAVALAEAHRPDLLAGQKAIEQASAVVQLERRKAKPQVALQPGWVYQNQQYINGFRNGSLFDIGISTTLPLTDRNQGNILKAKAAEQELVFKYQGDRAEALAQVEASVRSYADAVEHLTLFNTPETMKAARDLRQNMESAYRSGNRKLIDLLDAHKAYQSRLEHVIEFESFYWRSLNNLNAAVGLKAYDPERGAR